MLSPGDSLDAVIVTEEIVQDLAEVAMLML
jgi:hypothetical protein